MPNEKDLSHRASPADSAATKRTTPKIFMAALVVGIVAIAVVLTIGAKFVFH